MKLEILKSAGALFFYSALTAFFAYRMRMDYDCYDNAISGVLTGIFLFWAGLEAWRIYELIKLFITEKRKETPCQK